MITLIIVDLVLLAVVQFGLVDLDGGGGVTRLDGIELLDGDHAINGTPTPNVTHVFALRVIDGRLDLDDYEVRVAKVAPSFLEGVWYDANTTVGTVVTDGAPGGGDTAQFTLSADSHKDPYYPTGGKRVEVKLFRDGMVVWFSRWDYPAGVLVE